MLANFHTLVFNHFKSTLSFPVPEKCEFGHSRFQKDSNETTSGGTNAVIQRQQFETLASCLYFNWTPEALSPVSRCDLYYVFCPPEYTKHHTFPTPTSDLQIPFCLFRKETTKKQMYQTVSFVHRQMGEWTEGKTEEMDGWLGLLGTNRQTLWKVVGGTETDGQVDDRKDRQTDGGVDRQTDTENR